MSEDVLQGVCELESVDIPKSELDVSVDNQFCETKDFSTKMESIAESRLLALLGRQSFDRLENNEMSEDLRFNEEQTFKFIFYKTNARC
jgi:hypothetical protein